MDKFPLHELRTSVSEDVMCLMVVPMNKIDVGIKVSPHSDLPTEIHTSPLIPLLTFKDH